jgi:acetyl-CoA C-acetyltransferase
MLVGANARRVAIVGGVRIPFARGNGAYAEVGNQEMLTSTLRGVVERYGLQGQRVDEVAAGAVMKHSSQWNLTRESVLGCGLAAETPGLDLQRACGTGLEAAIVLGNKIALGQIDSAIAAGVDTVSDPPVVYPRAFQQLLLKSYRGKSATGRLAPWFGLRLKHLRPVLPGLAEPRTGLTMGESTELMVKTWGISWPWRVIRRQRPPMTPASTKTWCAIIWVLHETTTSAVTPRSKNSPSSSRCSIPRARAL